MHITHAQAAAELLRRSRLRGSLEQWSLLNSYTPAHHHRLLIGNLERLQRGEIKRLAVFMPPGSAKSTYGSILFPSWILANNPKALILAASHTTELAERWGRRVRNIILEHDAELDVQLQTDSLAAGRWATTLGGEYYAAGAGTGIAGFRGLFGLIDDPIRSRQDADSPLVRDRLWDWYLNDFVPRLIPDARQLLIQTRWHEDDLAGRALNHQPWEVLSLPALAKTGDQLGRKPGEPLWNDDDYGYGAQLVELQQTTPPRVWSALYQQEPTPDEGDFFKEQWLHAFDIAPGHAMMRTYGASDYAVTQDGGDYTVHVVFGVDHLNNLYLLDIWRDQTTSDQWVEALCDLIEKYRPLAWAEEQGQIRSGIGPFLEKRMAERRVYVNREQFPTRGDKAVRCRSIQGRMALDGLSYPKNAPWVADWLAEILNFPASKHDDQCVIEGTMISMAYGTAKPIEEVVIGDVVATPAGPWRVDDIGVTDEATTVYRVAFANGTTLTATPNHRLFVHGKGLVRVDELGVMDRCVEEVQELRLPNTKDIDIGDIPTAIILSINAISPDQTLDAGCFTDTSGKMSTVPFRRGIKSTTSTAIGPTTRLTISNALRRSSISNIILGAVNSAKNSGRIWRQSVIRLLHGIGVPKVALGIPSMVVEHGSVGQYFQKSVNAVASRSRQNLSELHSAASHAGCVIAVEALTAKAKVRNLTVRHAHVYYANGILSRNCDAMGLCGQLLDQMVKGRAGKLQKITLPNDGYGHDKRSLRTVDHMTL